MTRIKWTNEWVRTRSPHIPLPDRSPNEVATHGYYSNLNLWQALMESQAEIEQVREENDRLRQENRHLKKVLQDGSPIAMKMTEAVATVISMIVTDAYSNRSETEQRRIAQRYIDVIVQKMTTIADLNKLFKNG